MDTEDICRRVVCLALDIPEEQVTESQISIVKLHALHLIESDYGFSIKGISNFVKAHLVN